MLRKRETQRALGVQRRSPSPRESKTWTELERGIKVSGVWGKVRRVGRQGRGSDGEISIRTSLGPMQANRRYSDLQWPLFFVKLTKCTHWVFSTMGSGWAWFLKPTLPSPNSQVRWSRAPATKPLVLGPKDEIGEISIEKRTQRNLSYPMATAASEHAESAALQETASLGDRAYHLHTENCSCSWRTNYETFNAGLQLLNERKWALAGRRITCTHRAGSGRPA